MQPVLTTNVPIDEVVGVTEVMVYCKFKGVVVGPVIVGVAQLSITIILKVASLVVVSGKVPVIVTAYVPTVEIEGQLITLVAALSVI